MKERDGKITAAKLAELVGGELVGNGDVVLTGVNSLDSASDGDISFLGNKKYAKQVADTAAAAVLVGKDFDTASVSGKTLIVCDNPNGAFAKAVELFAPPPVEYPPGVHPAAVVADSATLGEGVHVGPCAVVEPGASIGDGTVVGAGCYVGHNVEIGANTLIYPNVSIRERCVVGSRVIIHSGTTIGSDGYGFEAGPMGIVKIPQVGIVRIGDDVEIGANCAIDRARFGETHLKQGVKLDNLVHVAHNVVVGEFSMLIGQCGIAGSTKIGRGAIIAAQAGINGHITIGDGAKVAGTAGVVKDVPPGGVVVGTPAEPQRDFMARIILPKTVAKLKAKVEELEKKIADNK